MKKVLILLLVVISFVSCKQDLPPIVISANIFIFVENGAGENLFDSAIEGNILDDDITIDYNGEIFILNDHGNVTMDFELRDGIPNMGNGLRFGPFWHGVETHTETFVIYWGDDTRDEVKFEWNSKFDDDSVYKVWVNGELQTSSTMTVKIIK